MATKHPVRIWCETCVAYKYTIQDIIDDTWKPAGCAGHTTRDFVMRCCKCFDCDVDLNDNDLIDVRDIKGHDGTVNVVLPVAGTMHVKGTVPSQMELDYFEYADDPTAQAAYPSNGHHAITFVDDAQLDTAEQVFGPSSLLLDGTGDYLTIPDSPDWDFGTDDFTIECGVRFASITTGGHQVIVSHYQSDAKRWYLSYHDSNDYLQFYNAAAPQTLIRATWLPNIDTWYHVALVRVSGVITFYVDGTALANDVLNDNPGSNIGDNTGLLRIGEYGGGWTAYLNGHIDEFRLSNSTARWLANFDVPTAPYRTDTATSLLLHFDGADEAVATIDSSRLEAFSEDTIVNQGTYSLGGFAKQTDSLNDMFTKAVSPTVDLSGLTEIRFDIYSSRTGANIKIGIHDSGGITTEKIYTQIGAGIWESVVWDISGVPDADKNDIDQIIVTIVNADADNTFYIDNMFGGAGISIAHFGVQDNFAVGGDAALGGDATIAAGKSFDAYANAGYVKLRRVSHSDQQAAIEGELLVWRDPDDGKTYLIINDADEGARKVELT